MPLSNGKVSPFAVSSREMKQMMHGFSVGKHQPIPYPIEEKDRETYDINDDPSDTGGNQAGM